MNSSPPDGAADDAARDRFPRGVYGVGSEPDPRFTLANERTFLAWIRTSLALTGAAVALDALKVPDDKTWRTILVVLLALAGLSMPVLSLVRWARAERALRLSRPLPASVAMPVLVLLLVLLGIAVVVIAVR